MLLRVVAVPSDPVSTAKCVPCCSFVGRRGLCACSLGKVCCLSTVVCCCGVGWFVVLLAASRAVLVVLLLADNTPTASVITLDSANAGNWWTLRAPSMPAMLLLAQRHIAAGDAVQPARLTTTAAFATSQYNASCVCWASNSFHAPAGLSCVSA